MGIRTYDGKMNVVIERNTKYKCQISKIFYNPKDNGTTISIRVLEGENEKAEDNKLLGIFLLDGIPAAPRGTVKVSLA